MPFNRNELARLRGMKLWPRVDFGFEPIKNPRSLKSYAAVRKWTGAGQRVAFFLVGRAVDKMLSVAQISTVLAVLVNLLHFVGSLVTPPITADLGNTPRRDRLLIVVVATVIATVAFSYFGNRYYALSIGTYDGTDSSRYYFIDDAHNRIIYLLIAPLYMGACAAVIVSTFNLMVLAPAVPATRSPINIGWRIFALSVTVTGAIVLAAAIQARYFDDNIRGMATNPNVVTQLCRDKIFWFVDSVGAEGERKALYLNKAGVYYICVQFLRMFTIFAAVWCVISAMINLFKLGFDLDPRFVERNGGYAGVRERISQFTLIEISAKCLVVALWIHFYVWGDSCLAGSGNINAAAIALYIFSFTLLATPRLLLEYKLLKCVLLEAGERRTRVQWPHLLDQRDRLFSAFVSIIFFVGIILVAKIGGWLLAWLIAVG